MTGHAALVLSRVEASVSSRWHDTPASDELRACRLTICSRSLSSPLAERGRLCPSRPLVSMAGAGGTCAYGKRQVTIEPAFANLGKAADTVPRLRLHRAAARPSRHGQRAAALPWQQVRQDGQAREGDLPLHRPDPRRLRVHRSRGAAHEERPRAGGDDVRRHRLHQGTDHERGASAFSGGPLRTRPDVEGDGQAEANATPARPELERSPGSQSCGRRTECFSREEKLVLGT
jgi:hypothetical protein